jgi:uncharacterized protein involved in outer membrane biogenesis
MVSVAALLGGAWYALDQYVKGDNIRQMVTQKITEATGRQVTIRDPLGLTFSLNPAVRVSGFTLANADWGSAPAMVTAETVLLRVDLARLLSREIVVQDLELERPRVLLEVSKAGKGNWQFTPQKPKTAEVAKRADATADTKTFRVVMQSVRIADGQVTYHDMAKDTRKTLTLQEVTLRPEGEGVQADLQGSYQGVPYVIGVSLKALQPLLRQQGEVPFDLTAKVADSTVTANGLVELVATQKGGLPVRRLQTELRAELPTFAAVKPFLPDGKPLPEFGPVQLRLAVEGTPQKLNLSPVQVQALESELAGTFTLTPPLDGRELALDGTAQLKVAALAKLGAAVQQKLADVPLTLATQVGFAHQTVRLEDVKVTAGESSLAGNILVKMPKDGNALPENLRVNLDAPVLRLADFTVQKPGDGAAKSGKTTDGSKAAGGPLFSREPLPLDGLRGLRADVKVAVGQLVLPAKGDAPERTFRDVRVALDADGRTVRLSDLKAALPGSGHLSGTARLDVGANPAALRYQIATTGMTLGTFLREWGVTEDVTGGPTRVLSEGQTAGASLHDWAANLSGETAVVVQKAQVQGGVTDFLGGPLVQALLPTLAQGSGKAVTLNCVVSRWPTRGGVMTTDLTLIDTGQLTVAGTGAVRLGEETIQMTLLPKAKQQSLSGVTPPVSIRGPLTKPSFRLDEKAVVGDVLQGVLSGRITTGKPLEVLGQVFGPRGGSGETVAAADPCSQVLTANGDIRVGGSAPAAAVSPDGEKGTEAGAAPSGAASQNQPQQGGVQQQLEERLDKILPGVGGLFGR